MSRSTPETDKSCGYALSSHYGRPEGSYLHYLQKDQSGPFVHAEVARRLERERDEAREDLREEKKFHNRTHSELIQTQCKLMDVTQAIIATLEGNRHLADGDDCTLAKLKSVVPEWK